MTKAVEVAAEAVLDQLACPATAHNLAIARRLAIAVLNAIGHDAPDAGDIDAVGPLSTLAQRCGNCRWWKRHLPAVPFEPVQLGENGNCTLFECHDFEQVHSTQFLNVMRTSSGEATIATDAAFGCVKFEAHAEGRR